MFHKSAIASSLAHTLEHMGGGHFRRESVATLPLVAKASADSARLRAKVWDLSPVLHCSIVGTCLTVGELRVLVRNAAPTDDPNPSDHELHTLAVGAVGTRDTLSRAINKAMDRRHKTAITHFAKAGSAEELLGYWNNALRGGDLPGAYWALLTHPLRSDAVVRHAFGDVHMLSHLLGGTNRVDIQKLHTLEQENSALQEKLARQQRRLRDDIVSRDARIRELSDALAASIEAAQSGSGAAAQAAASFAPDHLLIDLRKQLDLEVRRRERAETRALELAGRTTGETNAVASAAEELAALRNELRAAESALDSLSGDDRMETSEAWRLPGVTVLYVGGRPQQVVRLRSLVERASGRLIHHDGGIEQKSDLLPGLVSRADVAVFPVDCVSHDAAQSVKRLCRQAGKPCVPLRSNGLASFLNGLRSCPLPLTLHGS